METAGFAAALGLPQPLAALLIQRGVRDPDSARAFLHPRLASLSDPRSLAGMDTAVDLIASTIRRGEPILIHGDYDVDGQCAAALLTRALRIGGADAHPFLPHRMTDGYDFGAAGLAEAERIGARLILTCDCGITAVETVDRARAAGIAVVVTDHHLPGAVLPRANAVVDPQRSDDESGLGFLSGTGIAFKLIQALVPAIPLPEALPFHLLDYVALATVADVVPLIGENRTLVKHGLRLLAQSRWPGLRALVERAQLAGKEIRATQAGFILAPRLNAVGRIADAKDGLRLLLTDDPVEAAALADRLETLNRERQALDQRILDDALEVIAAHHADPAAATSIVLAADGWHPGVIGIVASRVVERYGRPTFLIGLDGDMGRGSGRSIDGFDLHAALGACEDLLERFGGHRMAAGLTIRRDRVDAFRDRFNAVAREQLSVEDLGPSQRVDLEVRVDQLTDELERWTRQLEPCGMGNPGAVLGVRNVRVDRTAVVGTNHLKGRLTDGAVAIETIAFGWADRAAPFIDGAVDVAVRLERNEWHGRSTLQARALTLAPTAGSMVTNEIVP
ncbi:MAG TPA: single-stranded-DNA-specific exonuclease RecJ [Gemmatimonadales bacterium]|jgi:single-stranded-DNA-specific exonuclease